MPIAVSYTHLKQFLDDGDIDMKQFWQMKQRVLDQMLGDK